MNKQTSYKRDYLGKIFICMTVLWSLFFPVVSRTPASMTETMLRKYLFHADFDASVRPVIHGGDNVTVTVDMSLNHIVDLNEKLQIVQTEIWVRLFWYDPQLSWNTTEYPGVTDIYVNPGAMWTPDIVIYNEVGLESGKDPKDFLVTVQSDGNVKWLYPRTIETSCKMDVSKFPYDTQRCNFIFGSWAFAGSKLDIVNKSDKGDSDAYVDNGEWMLRGIAVKRTVLMYACCPNDPFPDVTFTLVLQRRHLYYVFNLVLPCIIITLLNLTGFLLPAESGEKVSLNVTILLGLTVFLLLVAEIMPPQSETIPVIGQYFAVSIFLVSMATVGSVLILHLHFRGSRGFPVPSCVRWVIIGKLGYILCYGGLIQKTRKSQESKLTKDEQNEVNLNRKVKSTQQLPVTLKSAKFSTDLSNGHVPKQNGSLPKEETENETHVNTGMYCHDNYGFNTEGKAPMEDMGVLHRRIENKEEIEKAIIQDWILVSLILDRFFFVLMTIAQISAVIYVLSPLPSSFT